MERCSQSLSPSLAIRSRCGRGRGEDPLSATPPVRLAATAFVADRGTGAARRPEDSLISAVHTHALCMHTQRRHDEWPPSARRLEPAAHRPHLAAHTLHQHAYAALSRPREIHPRNSHLWRGAQHESAGRNIAHLHESARNQGTWWRGEDLNLRPSGYEPDELPDCSTPRRRDQYRRRNTVRQPSFAGYARGSPAVPSGVDPDRR